MKTISIVIRIGMSAIPPSMHAPIPVLSVPEQIYQATMDHTMSPTWTRANFKIITLLLPTTQ